MDKDKNDEKEIDYREFEDYGMNSCSATECTGLIPTLPQNEYEIESYEDVYHFLPKASASSKGTAYSSSAESKK